MLPSQVIKSGFLDNLGTDLVAVAPNGNIVGRASSRATLEHAHADQDVTIFSAADFVASPPTIAAAATASLDGPFAAIVAQGVQPVASEKAKTPDFVVIDDPVVAPKGAPVAPLPPGEPFKEPVQVDGSAFDRDSDGRVGGSLPKSGRQRRPAGK
jgi:hypothetical protein